MGCFPSKPKNQKRIEDSRNRRIVGKVDPMYKVSVHCDDSETTTTKASVLSTARQISFDTQNTPETPSNLDDRLSIGRNRPRAKTFMRKRGTGARHQSLRRSFDPTEFPSPIKSRKRSTDSNSKNKLAITLPLKKHLMIRLHTIRSMESDYVLGEELYRSTYCSIFKATHRRTQQHRVLKRYEFTTEARDFIFEQANREFEVLRNLDHPGIVRAFEMYETTYHYFLALDQCSEVSLHQRLKHMSITQINEATVGFVIFQILHLLSYVHKRKIIHRRINPSHVLFKGNEFTSGIKLTGFSLVQLPDEDSFNTVSPGNIQEYRAPEELLGSTTEKSDIWSVGALLYRLLTGQSLYSTKEHDRMVREILDFEFDATDKNLRGVTTDGKDFLSKLLCRKADKRMTAMLALSHPWIQNSLRLYKLILKPNFSRIAQMGAIHLSKLQQFLGMFILLTTVSGEEFQDFEKAFYFMSQYGVLYSDNLLEEEASLRRSFNSANIAATNTIYWEALEKPRTSYISFKEFLLVEWLSKTKVSQQLLETAFFNLDWNGDNLISAQDVQRVVDPNYSYQLVVFENLLEEFNGELDFTQFSELINEQRRHLQITHISKKGGSHFMM